MGGLFKLAIIGLMIWFFYQMLMRAVSSASQPGNTVPPPDAGAATRMRKCSYCGVHIPEGESTQSRGHFFCCEAHRNAFFSHDQ